MPYTYLIGWSEHNKYYYGVRYSKKSHPEELWKTYFTSSKHVKSFRKEYGEPDIVSVRKIFNEAHEAQSWENKVLRKLGAKDRKDFLNQTDNLSISLSAAELGRKNRDNEKYAESMRQWYKGLSESELKELNAKKRQGMLNKSEEKAKSQSEAISSYQKKSWADPETKMMRSLSMKKPKRKVECPHCGKVGGSNTMHRWHFNNCKDKTS